jgi:starch synthase (maltosyl-transferring)
VLIESIQPAIDGGRYAVKRVLGDIVAVSADLISDGHDLVSGELLVLSPEQPGHDPDEERGARAISVPLEVHEGDRHGAHFLVDALGLWHYALRAWIDHFATWQRGLRRKLEAGQDISVELAIGGQLLAAAAQRAAGEDRAALEQAAVTVADGSLDVERRARQALLAELARRVARYPDRTLASTLESWLPVRVDRERARFSSWYEMFPRSTGPAGQHGTLATAIERLPYVASMGFDVLYLPPIHPIGHSFRKGKNNQTRASNGDVGSPWAIGAAEGGHDTIHPELGTLADFERFRRAAESHGLELALDVALQVTPDHPYVSEHPEWFKHRPDGSIQYAENPPKKYEDIYPFDFECDAWRSLWLELKHIFELWIARGVRIFRVDNPHTKSLGFWRWCIAELSAQHPDVIFLAEAFTRPKLMYALAKLGFTQSYTYFTWRNTAQELRAYLQELTAPPVSEFFRPNFWPNTPDILPEHLQHAGPAAFALRLALAALLSSNYGIYGPAFELMENVPRPGAEEYIDNEKYELKVWDVEREDSLRPLIARINAIRKENPALQQNSLTFHPSENELLLCFSKHAPGGDNSMLIVINMDVHNAQAGWIDVSELLPQTGKSASPASSGAELQLHDLLSDARFLSQGRRLYVRLDPRSAPAHIFRLRRLIRSEHDFDYFV